MAALRLSLILLLVLPYALSTANDYEYVGYILLDTSRSMQPYWEEALEGLREYLSTAPPAKLGLYIFKEYGPWDCRPEEVLRPTTQLGLIATAARLQSTESGTPLIEALDVVLRKTIELSEKEGKRGLVVIFTDGENSCPTSFNSPCEVIEHYYLLYRERMPKIVLVEYKNASQYFECLEGMDAIHVSASVEGQNNLPSPRVVFAMASLAMERASSCEKDSDCYGRDVCIDGTCTPANLHFVIVPINWGLSKEDFYRAAKEVGATLTEGLGMGRCPEKVKVTIAGEREVEGEPGKRLEALVDVLNLAANYAHEVDFAIGLTTDLDLMRAPDGSYYGSVGYTIRGLPSTVVYYNPDAEYLVRDVEGTQVRVRVQGVKAGIIALHELGHQMGLRDEYCWYDGKCGPEAEPNPLRAEYGCDPATCCWCKEEPGKVCCEGNLEENGYQRSAMAGSSIPSFIVNPPRERGGVFLVNFNIGTYSKPAWDHIRAHYPMVSCSYSRTYTPPNVVVVDYSEGGEQGTYAIPGVESTFIDGPIRSRVIATSESGWTTEGPLIEGEPFDIEMGGRIEVGYAPLPDTWDSTYKVNGKELEVSAYAHRGDKWFSIYTTDGKFSPTLPIEDSYYDKPPAKEVEVEVTPELAGKLREEGFKFEEPKVEVVEEPPPEPAEERPKEVRRDWPPNMSWGGLLKGLLFAVLLLMVYPFLKDDGEREGSESEGEGDEGGGEEEGEEKGKEEMGGEDKGKA